MSPLTACLFLVAASLHQPQRTPRGSFEAVLPPGVHAEWNPNRAWREATRTREKICLSGLWRWQPATSTDEVAPTSGWGWFKVPGPWPGITDYMEKDCQTVVENPGWKGVNLSRVTGAWYEREFETPASWAGRRILIEASYVNSLAFVQVDGEKAGVITFPAGSVDITSRVRPGKHRLSILVLALPLKAALLSYADTNHAKTLQATVPRRGLCGDVFIQAKPAAESIEDIRIQTSYRKKTLTVWQDLRELDPARRYMSKAEILDHGHLVKTLISAPFLGAAGRSVSWSWMPEKLWDIDTPQNQYELRLSLLTSNGKLLDTLPPGPFGFREFWIDGKDFYLNGSRIFWSLVPLENAGVSAGMCSYDAAKETMLRLKQIGINMVYTHNYDCEPGSFLSFDELLRAADDVGVLVALTQPHFSDYDWDAPGADATNGYERHARFFVHVAGSHPSVIAYATSHNATGYSEDMNPDMIDGVSAPRDQWASNNVKKALRAEAIIQKLDPSRFTYHHSSGNLGAIYSMNFYLNFVPVQELDDWFIHWSQVGVKPAVTIEYGVPFSWDWSMYRGYYKGKREWGSAQVPWEYCMAEWNAQFLGDSAYEISESEKRNLRWEAPKFRDNQTWFRWDYPYPMGSTDPGFEDQQRVFAEYTTDNWRAFRTLGVSGTSPWETSGLFWRLDPSVKHGRVNLPTAWDDLQRPGYSPDYIDGSYDRRDLAYRAADWKPTTGGLALLRNNRPLLAYIGGRPGDVTEKGHNFSAGQTVTKQLVLINNSRRLAACRWSWSLDLTAPLSGGGKVDLPTGRITELPLRFTLPPDELPGTHHVRASVDFGSGNIQQDEFAIQVLASTPSPLLRSRFALYDPQGGTANELRSLGVKTDLVSAASDLTPYDVLIIGKNALTVAGPGIDLSRVPNGLKVLVFEQSSEVLEQRLGFRVQEYGLRDVFERVAGHPVLAGLSTENLRDWQGSATLLPAKLTYQTPGQFYGVPAIVRNGILSPRAWRCGNRGDVASVLIEKPASGDFLPLLDGGFSLEYTPLLEYREGRGCVVFCQLDVTGRSNPDPAARRLISNVLKYMDTWKPASERSLLYVGEDAGRRHLELEGFRVAPFDGRLGAGQVLAIGPGSSGQLERSAQAVVDALHAGARVVSIGGDPEQVGRLLGIAISTKTGEYINSTFGPLALDSPAVGIGPSDIYSHEPRNLPLISSGEPGRVSPVLSAKGGAVFFGLAPWSFDPGHQNTKRTFRRTSFALARILGNLGVHSGTPLLARFSAPVPSGQSETRWLQGLYLDKPEEWDDPYRFFGW